MIVIVVCAAVLGVTAQGDAEERKVGVFEIAGSGELSLDLPRAWMSTVGGDIDSAPTISLRPDDGRDAVLMITASPRRSGRPLSEQDVLDLVRARGEAMLSAALQDELEIAKLEGTGAIGYLYHLTDRKPEAGPGDYREVRMGAVLVGDLLLSVTVLSHSGDNASVEEALEALSSARYSLAAQESGAERTTLALSLEGKSWSLLCDLPGFEVDRRGTRRDGSGTMFQASNRETDVIVSVFLESTSTLNSSHECREHYWEQASMSPIPKSRIVFQDRGAMALVYSFVEEYQGAPAMQQNINAYMYRDGVCVDIHLSKADFTSEDKALFPAILETVRYSDE